MIIAESCKDVNSGMFVCLCVCVRAMRQRETLRERENQTGMSHNME